MLNSNQILHKQCNIKLQTNHHISVKSVNVCKSCSMFGEVNPKYDMSFWQRLDVLLSKVQTIWSLHSEFPLHARM